MSTPLNPLSKFRSYRYYHVLALCNNSATAEALARSTSPDFWIRRSAKEGRQEDEDSDLLNKWAIRQIATEGQPDGAGKYSILIHGMADADLSISTFKLTAFTAANATQSDRSTSNATEGEMTISEPKGVVFFDTIVNCVRSMGTDAATSCFVLKTFFVGYSSETDQVEYINDLDPVMFYVTDATANFSEQGGEYTLQFVALVNGVTRLPQYARAADGIAVHLAEAGSNRTTVKTALEKLFTVIGRNYEHHYDCVISVAKNKGQTNPEQKYAKVQYEIEVDDVYSDAKYFISDAPIQYKIGGNDCFEPPSFKNNTGASIEDAIHKILNMCPQVKKDMVDGDGGGPNAIKYEYKINSSLKTFVAGNTTRYKIKYVVQRFLSPRGLNIQKLIDEGGSAGTPGVSLRENLITFDYIFSGKNIDILEFDIKLNYGLAYLQTASTANTFKDQFEVVSSRSTQISNHSDQAGRFGDGDVPVPVFFSPQIRGLSANNTQSPADTAQAAFTMAKHASVEVAEAMVKIIGNPTLYASIAKTTQPDTNVSLVQKSLVAPSGKGPIGPEANFKHWSTFPALAKINIYMPSNNDDVALMSGATNGDGVNVPPDYTRPFWYDGYYYVYGVESYFNEGEFTQQLMMVAVPNGSKLETGELKTEDEKTVKSITDCYDSKSAIRSTPLPQPNIPFEPERENTAIRTRQDAETVNEALNGSPADVRGWNTATQAVKDAILNAAAVKGIDARLLAQVAKIESSFNPYAKAKTSSATGLYQHIDNTWMGLVESGRINTIPANTPKADALSRRTNPVDSALGGAAYIRQNAAAIGSSKPGDIYLAHFAGPGVAKKVIAACNGGRGDDPLEVVIGVSLTSRMRRANAFLGNIYSAEQLRSWAAKKIATTLRNGVSTTDAAVAIKQDKGSQTTTSPTAPVTGKPVDQRSAGQAAASANGNTDTAANPAKKECGTKTPPATDQQGKTNADQASAKPFTRTPQAKPSTRGG